MSKLPLRSGVSAAICAVAIFFAGAAFAALANNQTAGFGNDEVLTFTYHQNFSCIDQPGEDLDLNGIMMESDPEEFQTPICQVATQPTIGPTGNPIKKVASLYVLVPMFSVNNDRNSNDAMACPSGGRPLTGTQQQLCGTALGDTLKALFGNIPEAWKTTVDPSITTQCPDPNHPVAGTCTTHASALDLAPALAALKLISKDSNNIFLPTPNHSHIIDNGKVVTKNPIWWQVRPVLIFKHADWPAADASSGITSVKKMDDAEKDKTRAIEVPSNFFLFFSSAKDPSGMAGMPGM